MAAARLCLRLCSRLCSRLLVGCRLVVLSGRPAGTAATTNIRRIACAAQPRAELRHPPVTITRAKSDGMVEVHVIKGDLADLGDFGSYGGIVFELFYRVDLSTF